MSKVDLNVTVLAYSRYDSFKKVIHQCEKNLTKVTVCMDAPNSDEITDQQNKITELIKTLDIEVNLIKRGSNLGLVRSVLTSIDEALQRDDHFVLLEDDCLPSDSFFSYMSKSLTQYKHDTNVSSVCGTITRCPFNPWGWGSWSEK